MSTTAPNFPQSQPYPQPARHRADERGMADAPSDAASNIESEYRSLLDAIDAEAEEAIALVRWMSQHPELSLHEHETKRRYVEYLEARGFVALKEVAGLETAFLATRGAADAPVAVALLAWPDF